MLSSSRVTGNEKGKDGHMKLKGLMLATIMLLASLMSASAADIPRMSVEELNGQLGQADLVVVDARSGRDWSSSSQMIAGALRGNPGDVGSWDSTLGKDQTIVLYCT
jgi:hypothetical protein